MTSSGAEMNQPPARRAAHEPGPAHPVAAVLCLALSVATLGMSAGALTVVVLDLADVKTAPLAVVLYGVLSIALVVAARVLSRPDLSEHPDAVRERELYAEYPQTAPTVGIRVPSGAGPDRCFGCGETDCDGRCVQ